MNKIKKIDKKIAKLQTKINNLTFKRFVLKNFKDIENMKKRKNKCYNKKEEVARWL